MAKKSEIQIKDDTKWVMFSDFKGWNTIDDPEKIKDYESPEGENISFNNGDRISLRNEGLEQFGDLSAFSVNDPITSMHTFRKRNGDNIMMASFGTYLVYYNNASESWEILKSDASSGKIYGFADYTLHTDTSSQVYFGNGVDYFSRWSGNYTKLTSAVGVGDTLINIADASVFSIGGSIIMGGTSYSYLMYGGITGIAVVNVGSGYSVNDVLTVVQAGASGGTVKVTSVDGTGKITGVSILTAGTNYHSETSASTTVAPAGGSGATITINGINSNNTITLLSPATAIVSNGAGISDSISTYSSASYPKGNIYLMADNRLFVSGVSTAPQAVYFSKYGDPEDFTSSALVTASTATASGTFNLAEGGGAVTGLVFDEGSIYALKRSMIYKITLTDSLYTLQQIKPFDGKSQTIGGVNNKSIFTGSNYVFFITPDNQIMSLERIQSVDYPQNVPISLNIQPTVKDGKYDTSSGISFNDIAYFSVKNSTSAPYNNVVWKWNISDKFWDTPNTGWNISDWTVFYNGTSEDLYCGSSNATIIYKIINKNRDGEYDVSAYIKSKQFTFGIPQKQKIMTDLFIEGYITPYSNIDITLYLDDDGYTQTLSTTLLGTEKDYQFSQGVYNTFGANPFAIERIGSNDDFTWLTKFRIYLNKDFRLKPFYNCQIQFGSSGRNLDWEIIQYGFKVGEYSNNENRKLFKTFK